MRLEELTTEHVEDPLEIAKRVRSTRSWKVVSAIHKGCKTLPEIAIHIDNDDLTAKRLIAQAAPLIFKERIRESLPGAGRIRFFFNPAFEPVLNEMLQIQIPNPRKVEKVYYVDREPTEEELLKLPRFLYLNRKFKAYKRRQNLILEVAMLTYGPHVVTIDRVKRKIFGDRFSKRASKCIGNALKLLLRDRFIVRRTHGYRGNPEYSKIIQLARHEIE